MKLNEGTFKHIESELFSYHESLKEIEFLRSNMIHCKTEVDENVGGGRSSLPGQPTEQIATRLATHRRLAKLEEITNAIQRVYTVLPEDHQKLIRLKYWTKPQTLTWNGIAAKLSVGRATAFRWRDEIINTIAETIGWR